ncbi:MAG: FAD-dependent oxidoreductase [Dehalococcoidales bacterium]|nr:FAD-dependent oxidoreductase [Dehalococcoidales bacterium]
MAENRRFARLLEPGRIGSVRTRNRIIKTGAGTFMWNENELHMNENIKAYYESLARGGVGLLIVESPIIDYPVGARWSGRYRIDQDRYIEGLSELTAVIHKHNCPTFMQMNHDGPWQTRIFGPAPYYNGQPIAASNVTFKSDNDFHNQEPHVLTVSEIQELVDKFAGAAVRAQKAGFDGVDINSASSHLLHNFLSPFWNRRTDDYGGSTENRTRFLREIIGEIKKRLGKDFPVSICLNGLEVGRMIGVDDKMCLTPGETRRAASLFEEAGADAVQLRNHWMGFHVGGYLPDTLFYPEPPIPVSQFPAEYNWSMHGKAANILFAAAMKKTVSIPVIVVGRLDPELGEKYIRQGMTDFIGMTRRLQADPDLPNKVAEGRLEDIAPCTACENCLGSRRCRINTLLGTETNVIEKAPQKKKVMVVGGGPGGMEAARVAALRGHDVTLYEKSSSLGGLLPVAAVVKGTRLEDLPSIVRYFRRQLDRLGVKVVLGKEADAALVERERPDAVILATGGIPALPQIKGIDSPKVVSGAGLHASLKNYLKFVSPDTLRFLTRFYLPVGKRVVIIGGGIQGCELAEFLTFRGRRVTIVDTAETLGSGMVDVLMNHLFFWFVRKGVKMISGVKEYVEITPAGLTIIDKAGNKVTLEADSIIPALPMTPNMGLFESLKGKVAEIYAVGDCKEPLLIADATGSGSRAARGI